MATPFDDVTVGPTPTGTSGGATPFTAGPSRFAPGVIVAGRYRLVALLGRGGMGPCTYSPLSSTRFRFASISGWMFLYCRTCP